MNDTTLFMLLGVAFAGMIALGAFLGALIGLVEKKFAVPVDPRVDDILSLLPGANCGGCGCAGCADLAQNLVSGKINDPARCPANTAENNAKIGGILGISSGGGPRFIAVVRCSGTHDAIKNPARYNGANDCQAAMLVQNGATGCRYGCLGRAGCVRACPFNAIEMCNGTAKVHPERCVGCGKCVAACPRHLIELQPETVRIHVFCNSPEKGAVKRAHCTAGCIGCRKCERFDAEAIFMEGGVARIQPDHPIADGAAEKIQCPTKALRADSRPLPPDASAE